MEVQYRNKRVKAECTDYSVARRKYGQKMADKISLRIDQLRAAQSVEQMIEGRIGRCHPLGQNRKGQYALDLIHPARLIFEKVGDDVQVALVEEITDYH